MKLVENVTVLPVITKLPIPVERVIDGARDATLQSVTVIGETPDGKFYFASSIPDGPNVLWALEQAKNRLLNVVVEGK